MARHLFCRRERNGKNGRQGSLLRASAAAVVLLLARLAAGAAEAPRDPWRWPFAATSIWNAPIGAEAVYRPAGLGRAEHIGLDVERLCRVSSNAPERAVFAPRSWGQRAGGTRQVGTVRIDDELVVPDVRPPSTPNECAALLMPDGRTVRQLAPLCRPAAGGPVFAYCFLPDEDLFGAGIGGSHGGSGLSALGGSLRLGELTGPGPIRHALKVDLWCKRYAYFGADRPGFRWPASRADSYAAHSYGGTNRALVMGSLLALPPAVREETLGLKTPVGRKLFRALQDYGVYVVDDAAWNCHYLCAGQGVAGEVEQSCGLRFDDRCDDLRSDLNALFVQLCVIDNNAPDRLGGGGTPRAPPAPPLAVETSVERGKETMKSLAAGVMLAVAATAAEPAAPLAIRNPSMTDGTDQPEGWTQQWVATGKIKISRDTQTFASAPAALAIESVGGAAHGQAMQFFDGRPGETIAVSARICASGGAQAMFAVQSYTADWKGLEFKPLGNALSGQGWREAGGEVTLPAGTARFALLLMLDGEGKVWLDDVTPGLQPAAPAEAPRAPPALAPAAPATVPPPKPANAWSPGEGFWKDYPQAWRQTAQGQAERARKGGIDVVFIGDSLTQGWDAALWKERYAPLGAVNFGVGGDGTPQVLWRIGHGILDGIHPKVVVLMIGINNTWPGYSAEDTAKGLSAVVAAIRAKQPQTRILLLGVLPIYDAKDGIRATIRKINESAARLDDGANVRFLDFGGKLLDPDGARRADCYQADRLHLKPAAYRVWADAMDPLLKEWLR